MTAQALLLPAYRMPAHKEAKTPEAKLGKENEPKKKPITPPKRVDKPPKYGPRIMPIIGAKIAAIVMPFPGKPIMGEIDIKPKTT